jgi:FkbM family methyltransferase
MPRDAWALLKSKDRILRTCLDGIALAAQPDIIVDVGCFNANEIARFHAICPASRCYAFEANARNITDYIGPRSDIDGVVVNNLAVADYDGEIAFTVLNAEGGEDDWRRGAGSLNQRTDGIAGETVQVGCTRLDTYFAPQLLNDETFLLWIDVEGALDRVLAGAPKVLSRTIALRAEVERHRFWQGQTLADDILDLFDKAGFMMLADSYTPDAFAQSDVIMLNKNWLNLAARDHGGEA